MKLNIKIHISLKINYQLQNTYIKQLIFGCIVKTISSRDMQQQQPQQAFIDQSSNHQLIQEISQVNIGKEKYQVQQKCANPLGSLQSMQKQQMQQQNDIKQPLQSSSVIARRIWMYNISIDSIASSITKSAIKRSIHHQNYITTTLYRCKLQALSAYNYTYASSLTNIINMQFPFTMIQLISLDELKQDQQSHQVLYRFDLYDPECEVGAMNEESMSQVQGSNVGFRSVDEQMPLMKLLDNQYKGVNIDQFIMQYKSGGHDKLNSLNQFNVSSQHWKANLNRNQQKFQLKLQQNDIKEHQLISIFEVNLILNMFIRSYHLTHEIKYYAEKFREFMKNTLSKYPNATYE